MENALVKQQEYLRRELTWEQAEEYFCTADYNIDMAKQENVSLFAVWRFAYYVTFTWCDAKDIEELLGYK